VDNQGSEMRILIVWLEEFRDDLDSVLPCLYILYFYYLINWLLVLAQEQASKPRDICIIGIHPIKNRLFRISLNSNAQR